MVRTWDWVINRYRGVRAHPLRITDAYINIIRPQLSCLRTNYKLEIIIQQNVLYEIGIGVGYFHLVFYI